MEEYTFTPWTEAKPLIIPRGFGFPMHFIGRYKYADKEVNMYVRTCNTWHNDNLRQLYTRGLANSNYENSWHLQPLFKLASTDPAWARIKFLNDYVFENWWMIITECPLIPEG